MRKNSLITFLILITVLFPFLAFGYEANYNGHYQIPGLLGPEITIETQHGKALFVFNDFDYTTKEPVWTFGAADLVPHEHLPYTLKVDRFDIFTFASWEVVQTNNYCQRIKLSPYSLDIKFSLDTHGITTRLYKVYNGQTNTANGFYITDTGTILFIEKINNFVRATWYKFDSNGNPTWVTSTPSPIEGDTVKLTFYKYTKEIELTGEELTSTVSNTIKEYKPELLKWYDINNELNSFFPFYDRIHPTEVHTDQTITLHYVDNTPDWIELQDGSVAHLTKLTW